MRLQPAGSSPAGTSSRSHCVYCFCALLSHTSKNNSSLSCWITTLPDQSFVEFRSMGKSLLLQTLFFHFIFCLSVCDGELFVPVRELLRGSDLPFLGLRILDLLLWLQAVGQLSNHNAVLLTLQKFPSAYSGGSVNLVIDSRAAEF